MKSVLFFGSMVLASTAAFAGMSPLESSKAMIDLAMMDTSFAKKILSATIVPTGVEVRFENNVTGKCQQWVVPVYLMADGRPSVQENVPPPPVDCK